MARSPSYPQITLGKCIEFIKSIYKGAHRSTIDTNTLIDLMGYSSKSGRSLAAVGALKQFGLIEGRDDSIRITQDALTLLEPISEQEYTSKYKEVALNPPLFRELYDEFGGTSVSETVIRSIAVRKFNFTGTGAERLTRSYLETMQSVQDISSTHSTSPEDNENEPEKDAQQNKPSITRQSKHTEQADSVNQAKASAIKEPSDHNTLQFSLSKETSARVEFSGPLTKTAIERLIKHLELSAEIYED